jgi:competence protein ComEC
MGDAEKENEKFVVNVYKLPKMDILKVGHHGSKTSTSNDFIEAIKPKYAVISAGFNNRFNHPHQEVIDTFQKHDVKYFLTSINGSIRFFLKDEIIIESVR